MGKFDNSHIRQHINHLRHEVADQLEEMQELIDRAPDFFEQPTNGAMHLRMLEWFKVAGKYAMPELSPAEKRKLNADAAKIETTTSARIELILRKCLRELMSMLTEDQLALINRTYPQPIPDNMLWIALRDCLNTLDTTY